MLLDRNLLIYLAATGADIASPAGLPCRFLTSCSLLAIERKELRQKGHYGNGTSILMPEQLQTIAHHGPQEALSAIRSRPVDPRHPGDGHIAPIRRFRTL